MELTTLGPSNSIPPLTFRCCALFVVSSSSLWHFSRISMVSLRFDRILTMLGDRRARSVLKNFESPARSVEFFYRSIDAETLFTSVRASLTGLLYVTRLNRPISNQHSDSRETKHTSNASIPLKFNRLFNGIYKCCSVTDGFRKNKPYTGECTRVLLARRRKLNVSCRRISPD